MSYVTVFCMNTVDVNNNTSPYFLVERILCYLLYLVLFILYWPVLILYSCFLLAGDGRLGYPSEGPYNAIHVGAAAPNLPQAVSCVSMLIE